MSREDFMVSTPEEFSAIIDAWHDGEESAERSRWERMRIHAAVTVQPHVKGRITPRRLVPLPWDKPVRPAPPETPELTAEQRLRRFEALARK